MSLTHEDVLVSLSYGLEDLAIELNKNVKKVVIEKKGRKESIEIYDEKGKIIKKL
jgi:hypothetical protein